MFCSHLTLEEHNKSRQDKSEHDKLEVSNEKEW